METALIAVLTVVWIVLCVNMAGAKGHSQGNACLGGCLFGPFAVLYYLLARDVKTQRAVEQRDYQWRRAQHEHQQAQAVPPQPEPPPSEPEPPPPAAMPHAEPPPLTCPRCGALSPGGSTHCISCLTALSGTLEAHQ